MDGAIVSTIRFADHIVMIATKKKGDIQYYAITYCYYTKHSEIRINNTKMKILVCAGYPQNKIWHIYTTYLYKTRTSEWNSLITK